ncbi:MAG: GNAT family N-acetyltransferase [Geodermatophilaceae bacterium]|nr:GNAT family N-acetyltransferase [Geodermatophilaceae bacterium]
MTSDLPDHVVRPTRTATWNLIRGSDAIGSAYATCRPDRRWFVSIDSWDDAAYPPLLRAMSEDLRQDLHTVVRADDDAELERWRRFGFDVARREIEYELAVDPAVTGLTDTAVPDGIVLLSADAVAEQKLRELDDRLRADVPGTAGWRNDPQEFRDLTFDDRHYDSATYLVALDDWRQEFAGLVRVWVGPAHARLGLIGITSRYRRQGLARALLAAAFAPLHQRGIAVVTAEADATNVDSLRLLRGIGAVPTGESLELLRPWS